MGHANAVTRRTVAFASLAAPIIARAAPLQRLNFDVWRGRAHIGRHSVAFSGRGGDLTADILADIAVSLGPITLFRYRHQAQEIWRGGRFVQLVSHTITNGRKESLTAIAAPEGVVVRSLRGATRLAADSAPLTHWNEKALASPLFNPETGAAFRLKIDRQPAQTLAISGASPIAATRYALSGDADLVDWYDAAGVWSGLTAKANDGSRIDYRRSV